MSSKKRTLPRADVSSRKRTLLDFFAAKGSGESKKKKCGEEGTATEEMYVLES